MQQYDIFLFDADGTLYDYDKAEECALMTVFHAHGFSYTEAVRVRYRAINKQVWDSYEKGEISKADLQTTRFDRLFRDIGVQCNPGEFNAEYLAELGKGTFLIDGAVDICKKIVSCKKQIFIVTNGILATQEARIKHSLIKAYISGFFVSEFIGYQKPDIKYFEYVFSHIPQVGKEKILIIGDSLTADIAGGNSAGIDSCWFNERGHENHTDIMPTYEIRKLNELNRFIES